MKIHTHETTLKVFDEEKNLLEAYVDESYLIYPDEDKLLRNKITGATTDAYVVVNDKDKISDYEEIDKE